MGKWLHWWALLALWVLAASPFAAPLLAGSHPLAALLIRNFFARLCHQNPARSFMVQGSPAAVCVRCLGIYLGAFLGGLMAVEKRIAARCLWLALLWNVLDVVTETLHWHGNMPLPRFLSGLLLGAAAGALLFAARRSYVAAW